MKHLLIFIVAMGMAQTVWAKKFTVGLTANNTSPSVTSDVDTVSAGGMGMGGGFLFDFQIKKLPKIETGILLLNRNLKVTNTSDLEVSFNMLHIPMLFKKGFGKKKVSVELGVGGFYAMGSGSINETNPTTGASATYSFDEWQILKSDYGAEATFGVVWKLKKSELLFDFRYAMGLKDVSQYETAQWKFSDMFLLIGWRFGK